MGQVVRALEGFFIFLRQTLFSVALPLLTHLICHFEYKNNITGLKLPTATRKSDYSQFGILKGIDLSISRFGFC